MSIADLIMTIETTDNDSNIYLIQTLSVASGFFSCNKQLLYIAKDLFHYSPESIETEYLRLQTHVRIKSVKNNQTFKDDYYNLIVFKGSLDDPNLEPFLQLCNSHATHAEELSFKEFFYSLISLFQLPPAQSFHNIIGFYGELKLMQFAKTKMGLDISTAWHQEGPLSRLDFSNGEISIEAKTTLARNAEITIKHDQLFLSDNIFLATIKCTQSETGETVKELIDWFYNEPVAFNSIGFDINIAKEVKRVSEHDLNELRLTATDISFYNAASLNPFPEIPEHVNNLSYKLDLAFFSPLTIDDQTELLTALIKKESE